MEHEVNSKKEFKKYLTFNFKFNNVFRKAINFIVVFAVVFSSYPHGVSAEGVELIPRENDVLGVQTTTSDQAKDDLESIESFLNQTGNTDQSNIVASELGIFTLADRTVPSSAAFYVKAKFRTLSKKSYKAIEQVEVVIDNAKARDLKVTVFDPDGNEVKVNKEIVSAEFPTVLELNPPKNNFKPGRYRITVKESNGDVSSQDFTWGVLAINPNKAVYLPGEDAHFSIAVLDEGGQMVCDASVKLKVKSEKLKVEEELSTENGLIKVNKECLFKGYTQVPDYEATYHLPAVGNYDLILSATTKNGTYSVNSNLQVREEIAFDIERSTATRIYPYEKYPVEISFTANQDFEGTVEEIVPGSFEIEPTVKVEPAKNEDVLGESTEDSSGSAQLNPARDASSSATLQTSSAVQVITTQNQNDTSFSRIEEYSADEELAQEQQPVNQIGLPFKGDFEISQGFGGEPDDPTLAKKYKDYGVIGHDGIDFETPLGIEVSAADDGVVARARENYDYGTTIVIEHSWGKSYYGHLSKLKVKEGESVKKGAEIGLSGNTGLSTGPHLHFGIKPKNNNPDNGYFGKINPTAYLASQVLGASTEPSSTIEFKKIVWNVNVKKGDKITLSYKYKAPLISPQFYLIGPAVFKDKNGQVVFNEGRRWQIAADAVTPTGVLGFGETAADDNMQFLNYTSPSTFTDRGNSVDVTTETNDIMHVIGAMAPTRDEMIWGQGKNAGLLNFIKCIGGCDALGDWSEELEIAGTQVTQGCNTTAGNCKRTFDVAYEQLSGRAIVFYGKAANEGILYYNIYDGTSWVGEASFTFKSGSTVDTDWIEAKPEGEDGGRKSDRIMVLISDTASDIFAVLFTAGSPGGLTTITLTSPSVNRQFFDFAWESVSGNGVAVWGEGNTATTTPYNYKKYVGGVWDSSNQGSVETNVNTGVGAFIEMRSHPSSDRIAVALMDDQTGGGVNAAIWKGDGSTAGWSTGSPNDGPVEHARTPQVGVAWEKNNSGTPFAMFVKTNAGDTDVSEYWTWTDAGTTDGTWSAFTDMPGEMEDDASRWDVFASPNSDEILAVGVEFSDDLCFQLWSGSAWDADCTIEYSTTLPPDTATAHNEHNSHSFVYRMYSPWSRNWRFYDGADTTNTPTTDLAAENTTPTGFSATSGKARLRFSVAELSALAQTDARKKLQYTTGDPDSLSSTWTDVDDPAGSGIWRYVDCNSGDANICNDNATLSATVLSGTPTAGWWVQDKDAAGGAAMDHSALQLRELEFSIEANSAAASTTYYFRMYDVDQVSPVLREQDNDGANDCATATCTYPSLTTAAGGGPASPTLDQLMRHGKWFNNGAEQPFTF